MTLYRARLRERAKDALLAGKTMAGSSVFSTRSWPIQASALPMIQLQVLADMALSTGAAAPDYKRTAGLLVTAKVAYGTPEEGEALLDTITEQIEMTLMLDVQLMSMVQQVSAIATEYAFDSTSGDQIGVSRIRFDLEYTQIYMPSGVPLAEINAAIVASGTGTVLANAHVLFPLQP